jgi:hypothetical protein
MRSLLSEQGVAISKLVVLAAQLIALALEFTHDVLAMAKLELVDPTRRGHQSLV